VCVCVCEARVVCCGVVWCGVIPWGVPSWQTHGQALAAAACAAVTRTLRRLCGQVAGIRHVEVRVHLRVWRRPVMQWCSGACGKQRHRQKNMSHAHALRLRQARECHTRCTALWRSS
jgi:hypothetical protein